MFFFWLVGIQMLFDNGPMKKMQLDGLHGIDASGIGNKENSGGSTETITYM